MDDPICVCRAWSRNNLNTSGFIHFHGRVASLTSLDWAFQKPRSFWNSDGIQLWLVKNYSAYVILTLDEAKSIEVKNEDVSNER